MVQKGLPNPQKLSRTADRLRWFRCQKSYLQKEITDYAGIDRSTYTHYEVPGINYYPPAVLSRIAEILEVDMETLMDGYNRFLYQDQGAQIRAKREALGLTISQYAHLLSVEPAKLHRWENNEVQVSKTTWKKFWV